MQPINIKKVSVVLLPVILCCPVVSAQSVVIQPAGAETYVIRKEAVTDAAAIVGLTNAEKARTINYVDGLGRPLQSIVAAGSPDGKDVVSFNKYDSYGRPAKQYLPFEASTTNGAYNDMSTILTTQATFYSPSTAAAKKIAGDDYPFAESSFEQSPLQRVIKAGGVGDGFQLNQHYKTLSYKNVTAAENIRVWVWGSSAATSNSTYGDDELTVSEVEDEEGAVSKVYTDKFRRLILKRQKKDNSTNYDTYYVYDYTGNIAYIVPPKALVKMGSNFTTANTPELVYRFWYDSKNRVVQKKVPGAKEVYMVYDPLDRVVLTQDGTMRSSGGTKWAYVKYDNANRVVIQGIYTHGTAVDQSTMQGHVDGQSCFQANSNTYYEVRQAGTSGYSNQCFPTTNTEERGYNYFDHYDFDYDGNPDYSKQDQGLTGEATATSHTYGLATGSKTKILGTNTWLVNVSFYDKYYHVIQVRSNNQLKTNVTDHTTNVVNFAGQALEAKQVKTINDPNGITGTLEIEVSTRYEYDDMGRLTKVKQTNPNASEVTVAKYEYNPLGQLIDKKLHSTNGTTYLQSVDMRYNIRGQLLSINNSKREINSANNDESNDVFGMEILYEKAESTSLGNSQYYNGMISAVKWSTVSPASTQERSFKYNYDKLYRLTASIYQEKNSLNGLWGKNQDAYNETLTYDENGNILTLLRKAVISNVVTTIDDLTYTYKNSDFNNQLENISDAVTTNAAGYGYRNFTNTSSSTPYDYDDNGNLKTDLKKGTTITYNELNKPTLIQISSTKKVEYRYDATGTRLSKIVTNNSTTKTIEYIGGYVIENDILSYYSMAEGRVRNEGGGFGLVLKMEYFITDHQGNTRVSFEDNSGTATLIQENSYYAFGMQMGNSYMPTNANKKLYNAGSEWQDDIDGLADYYSTFFREYDAVIGRFNRIDPMAETDISVSLYVYAGNSPINYNDPLGNRKLSSFRDAQELADYIRVMGTNNIDDFDFQTYVQDINNYLEENGGSGEGGDAYERLVSGSQYSFLFFDIIEEKVRDKVLQGQYRPAIGIMRDAFPDMNAISSSEYWISYDLNSMGHSSGVNANTEDHPQKYVINISTQLMDKWARGETIAGRDGTSYVMTFSDIVRSIFHEIIHLANREGVNGYKKISGDDLSSKAERETIAYDKMFSPIRGLKSASMNFQHNQYYNYLQKNTVVDLQSDGSVKYYQAWPLLNPTQQTKYLDIYINMSMYVFFTQGYLTPSK